MELERAAQVLKKVLGLRHEPIAVKCLETETYPEGFEVPSGRRYCQLLMGAREGRKLLLTKDNISCPAAAWALGLKGPPAKLCSGEIAAGTGIFASPAAAKKTLETMPRLPMGKYKEMACCPLSAAPFEPDVIVLEASAEQLMWVALAAVFDSGGSLEFNTAVLQATCVDVTIVPFLRQRINVSLGCYGCREATSIAEGDCVLGFPYKDLERIVTALQTLNDKALPRVRSKTVYKALKSRPG